jgi:hypothetical protein
LILHPEGKKGRNVEKEKYDLIKLSIVECLRKNGELTPAERLVVHFEKWPKKTLGATF